MKSGLAVTITFALGTAADCGGGVLAQRVASMPDVPDALIQMRRAGCAGEDAGHHCPAYGLSIFADGTVTYEGRANVATLGQRRGQVSADKISELVSAIDAMHFLDSPERCCLCPDVMPSEPVTIDYRPGSVQKTVLHDEGCRSAPAAIGALEQAIDRIAGVARWTQPVLAHGAPAPSEAPERAVAAASVSTGAPHAQPQ